jgi:hypothetical protein
VDVPKVPGKFIFMTSEVQNILLAMIQKGGEAKEAY